MFIPMTAPTNASSTVASVGVDDSNNLVVQFVNGKTYSYEGAGDHHNSMVNAESCGRFLNSEVKPNYTATLLS